MFLRIKSDQGNNTYMDNFNKVRELFQEKAGPNFPYTPSEKFKDQRCGGWIVRNENNKILGWVSNSGHVDVYHEVELKPGDVYNGRPVRKA